MNTLAIHLMVHDPGNVERLISRCYETVSRRGPTGRDNDEEG